MSIQQTVVNRPGHLLALALSMTAMSAGAQAEYAVSYTEIANFSVTGATSLFDFTYSTDVAAEDGIDSDANVDTLDAAPACVGSACAGFNNNFTAHGASGDYAYGDAKIFNDIVLAGSGKASSIGEVSSTSTLGFADGTNTLTGFVTTSGNLTFSFNATPYQQVSGGLATATSAMSVTLLDFSNAEIFSWTPNGNIGTGIVGGSETFDNYSLNLGIAPGVTYNPGTGLYTASTASLAAGTYKINITMNNHAVAQAVPEADTYAMLLAGLGLVGFMARRRSQQRI
jgi:hypothetical protein